MIKMAYFHLSMLKIAHQGPLWRAPGSVTGLRISNHCNDWPNFLFYLRPDSRPKLPNPALIFRILDFCAKMAPDRPKMTPEDPIKNVSRTPF